MTRKRQIKSTESTTTSEETEDDEVLEELPTEVKKKGKDEAPVKTLAEIRADKLKDVMGAVGKKYGAHALASVGIASYRPVARISCGILQIDKALGGGIPKGRISMFIGDFSAGKTEKILRTIADAQSRSAVNNQYIWEEMPEAERIPYRCLFVDMEGTFDAPWAKQLGVDTEALVLARPQTLEEGADILLSALQSGAFDLVALDSIAQMVTEDESESSMDEPTMGTAAAKKNNSMFRRIQSTLNRLYKENDGAMVPTVLFTNQIREKIGVKWGDKTTLPGGRGQEFYATCIIQCWAEGVDFFDTERSMPKSGTFGFKIKKNKISAARAEGKYDMALGDDPSGKFKAGDVLEGRVVYDFAEKLGFLGKKTQPDHYFCFDDKFKTQREVYAKWFYVRENYAVLKKEILRVLCPKQ